MHIEGTGKQYIFYVYILILVVEQNTLVSSIYKNLAILKVSSSTSKFSANEVPIDPAVFKPVNQNAISRLTAVKGRVSAKLSPTEDFRQFLGRWGKEPG